MQKPKIFCKCKNRKTIAMIVGAVFILMAGYLVGSMKSASSPDAAQPMALKYNGTGDVDTMAAMTETTEDAVEFDESAYAYNDSYAEIGMTDSGAEHGLKKHYRIYMSIQTLDYDKTMSEINELLKSNNASIISSSESDSNSVWYSSDSAGGVKYADLEIRIPTDRFEGTVQSFGGITGKVVSKSISSVDNTRQYNGNNDRLEALKAEKEQMLRLMEEASSADSLIAFYQRLTDINTEIAGLETSNNDIQYDTDYAEMSIHVETVNQYTDVTDVNASFLEKLVSSFKNGCRNVVDIIQNTILTIAEHWYVCVLIAVCVIVIVIVKKKRKKIIKEEEPEEEVQE